MEQSSTRDHEDLLRELFGSGKRMSYRKDDVILRADDTPSGVYLIEGGAVKAYSISDRGDENLRIISRTNEIFPLVWAFKNQVGSVNYEAMNDVSLLRISREEFLKSVRSKLDLSNAVIDQAIEQYFVYKSRIDNLELSSAYERVVYWLLFLASRFGEPNGQATVINVPLTHADIASSINVARETASRELDRLQKKGLISQKSKKFEILDLDGLAKILGDDINLESFGLK